MGEIVDHEALRREIREKYRDVAVDPDRRFEFCTGRPLAEQLGYPGPIGDALPDRAVESFAGAINLCADKRTVFAEIHRVLRPGGAVQFADIANGRPVPPEALRDIDLWTA